MRVANRPELDVQGHRGARGLLPENTVPSFLEAVRHGVHALELDVVLSADDAVVVSHEPWMNHRFCSDPQGRAIPESEEQTHNLFTMTLAEIQRYDCGKRGHPNFPHQRPLATVKPTLSEVVAAVDAFTDSHGVSPRRFNIELKSYEAWVGRFQPAAPQLAARVYAAASELGLLGRCTLQSFDPHVVEALRALDRSVELSLLVENHDGLEANLARLTFTPDLYSPFYQDVDAALVEAVHARGMLLVTWTVNHADEMRALQALGVDGLITDHPERAAEVFGLAPLG